jgi:hypothetical protein
MAALHEYSDQTGFPQSLNCKSVQGKTEFVNHMDKIFVTYAHDGRQDNVSLLIENVKWQITFCGEIHTKKEMHWL